MEDQPLPADASPTALSPGYIADFDPEEDEEDPADHPVDGGDNDDNESSDDDDDDDDVVKDEEDEEEEEHLAPADPSATKTNMAYKSVSRTKQQEDKVAENASNKREWEGNHNGCSSQQNKGHKVPRAYTTRPTNKKAYAGSLPLCNQCKFHHNGPCTVKCGNCKNVGHITQDYRTPVAARNQ
ncbi:hypothetical protein Tco_1150622 [Tanacetum coccineum]